MKFSGILFISFLLFAAVNAKTYYVSNDGSNSDNGSHSDPWETLQHAADKVGAGDTVMVKSGYYIGFNMDTDGTSEYPIVFKAMKGATISTRNTETTDAINLEGADYIVIDGFMITNGGESIERAGIRSVANTGVIIKNNTIIGMGRWGIFTGFSESVTIENNSCSLSKDEHGIYHSNSADNPVIRKNTCFSNNGCGIHMNADLSMGGDGIISNANVEANIIYDNGRGGGSGINCDGVQNSMIRNNLIYNNHASGISLYHIDGAEGAKNNMLVNNTIVMPSDGRWAVNITTESTGTTLYNNIFFTDHSFRGGMSLDASSISGTLSDHNVMADRLSLDGGDTRITLEEWQTATGHDMHSYISTPEEIFVGVHNNDYQLLAGCEAINNGTKDNAPWVDIDGNPRPVGGKHDIGAYEYQGITAVYTIEESVNDLIVYPNPATEYFEVHAKTGMEKIEIISSDGSVVKTIPAEYRTSVRIPSTGFEKGLCFIRVFSEDDIYLSNLIIH